MIYAIHIQKLRDLYLLQLAAIIEKPQYDLLVNTGMYLLNPEVLKNIPKNELFHITDLIEKLQIIGKKIGVYPVSPNSWLDIGQLNEFKKLLSS